MSTTRTLASTLFVIAAVGCDPDEGDKVNNSIPTAEILSHSDGDVLVEGYSVTFRGSGYDADDGPSELIATWWLDGEVICTGTALDTSGFSECEFETPLFEDFGAASVSLELELEDTQGATDTYSVQLEVGVTDVPGVTILTPVDGDIGYADVAVALDGLVSDDYDNPELLVTTWESDLDGTLSTAAADSAGYTSEDVTLSAGTHTITLWAEDTLGKLGSDAVSVTVFDTNTAPSCEITEPSDGSAGAPDAVVSFAATATDAEEDPTSLLATLSSDVDGELGSANPDADGLLEQELTDLSAGEHVFTLVVEDSAGLSCETSSSYTVGEAPIITISSPSDGDVVNEGEEVQFTASIVDESDAANELTISWESNWDGVFNTDNPNFAGDIDFSEELSQGQHEITLTAIDTDGFSNSETLIVSVNGLPSAPTITLAPDPAVTTDTLTVTVTTDSTDAEGDAISYGYAWSVDGTVSSVSTGATFPASDTAKGDTISVEVTPNDGTGDGTSATASVSIDNTEPSLTSVTLTPSTPYEGDSLTCTPGTASDDDGDTITYRYSWTVDGNSVSASSSDLDDSYWSKGEDVYCTVTPSDGTKTGTSVPSNTVTIENSLPGISSVSISPTSPEVSDTLTCSYTGFSDDDGDSDSSTYEWSVGGSVVGTNATLSSGFSSGDTVTCSVTPNDGEDDGTAIDESVTVDNTVPSISSVSISPSSPQVADTLTCSYTGFTDADGDSDQSTYEWTVNGSSSGSSSTLSGAFGKGDTVVCIVTPYDGSASGTAQQDSVDIENTAPVLADVTLTPSGAIEGDALTCTPGSVSDADGDSSFSYTYAWNVDGTSLTASSSTLDDSYWSKGEPVYCTVTPNDGSDNGSGVPSNTITIGNAAPSISSVSISPSSPAVTDDLTCSYSGYSDPDGDGDSSTYSWTVGGSAAGSSATLSTGSFASGDTVICEVTPDDGTDTGTAQSATVTVGNSAPSIASVSISPSSAVVGDTLTCSYSGYSDADSDPDSSTYLWTVDGSSAGTSSTLSSGFSGGDTVMCTVTPYDGFSSGTAVDDSIVIGNTAPELDDVSLFPTDAQEGDTLTCTPGTTSDADGDTVSYRYAWSVEGASTGTSDTTLSDTYWDKGEDVICTVTPEDGSDDGLSVPSNTVTILNTEPEIDSVSVSPADAAVSDPLTCSYSGYQDADGDTDASTYSWTISGTEVGTSSTLSSGYSSGDTVTCTVTPNDGEEDGTALSETVSVGNSAPELDDVDLSPTDAEEGDTLTCTAGTATDADGDSVTYTYAWRVEGALLSATTSTLSDTWWDKYDDVYCTVTPSDGDDSGDAVDSNTVTIQNALPEITSVSISPTAPEVTDTLTFTYSGFSDADGDSDSSTYSWTISGSEVGTSSTLAAGTAVAGDTAVCTVTPNDGDEDGTALSDSVDIENAIPSITSVSVSPSDPTVSDTLTCTYSGFSDDDGDTDQSTYSWTIGGTQVGTSSTLSSSFSKADEVTCTVTPYDGTDTGTALSDDVTVENSLPVLDSVDLSPTSAFEGDTLTCTPSSSDADGDTVTYAYSWTVNGASVGSTSSTLSDTFWDRDEDVICNVVPSDDEEDGADMDSNTVQISNSEPSITSVSISPSTATASSSLTCSYSGFSDADSDSDQSTYSWTIDGSVVGTSSTLSSGFTGGDDVICEVTPDDGTDTGTVLTDSVTIDNSAPSISSVSVTPSAPGVGDTLTCSYSGYSDADSDADQSTYSWTIGGTEVGTSSTLSSGYSSGDTVTCEVTPYDGTDTGTALSDSALIENTAPVISNISISPSSPVYGSTMSVSYTTTDADGDAVTVAHAWYVGSTQVSTSTSISVSSYAVEGDTIYVELTPEDADDQGSTGTSSTVTVGNTPPTDPVIDATDDPESGVDDILCEITTASTDVDTADTVSYVFTWEADGAVYPDDYGSATGPDTTTYTDDTVPAADTTLATDWTCTVYATDGDDSSSSVDDTSTVLPSSGVISGTRDTIASSCSSLGVHNKSYALAQSFTLSSSATVTGFGIGFDTASASQCTTCAFAVYDDDSGPDNLLGEGSGSCSAGGEVEITLGSTFSIPSSGTYWVAHSGDSCSGSGTNFQVCESTTSADTWYVSHSSGAMPDPFGGTNYTDTEFATWVIGY